MVIGIDHDTVCAGVVCAATPGTARVEPAVARPLAAAPAGPTDFPSSAIERICGALNCLVSDVIIDWHAQHARRKMSLITSALPNVLFVMACRWIVGNVKLLKNDAMEPEEITNIEIYRLVFILKRHVWHCT